MHGIKTFRFPFGEMNHFHGNHPESVAFETTEEFPYYISGNAIRLNNG